jgi:hypothetical protein
MNWLNGFTIGLCLGTTLFTSVSALRRRQQQRALESLLQTGAYRLLKADGSNAAPGELLVALGLAGGQTVTKNKLVTMLAVGIAAGVLAMFMLRAL